MDTFPYYIISVFLWRQISFDSSLLWNLMLQKKYLWKACVLFSGNLVATKQVDMLVFTRLSREKDLILLNMTIIISWYFSH